MKRIVPLSGILAVVLLVVSFVIVGESPDADAPVSEVTSWYAAHHGDLNAGAMLLFYSSFFALAFFATLRKALRRAEVDGGTSAYGFAGGIIFVVGQLLFGALGFTLSDQQDTLQPAALQTIHVLNEDLWFPLAIGTATAMLGYGIAILKTAGAGRLPRWMGWVAVVLGVVALTPAGFFALLAMLLWIAATSILLFLSAPPAAPAGTPAASPTA